MVEVYLGRTWWKPAIARRYNRILWLKTNYSAEDSELVTRLFPVYHQPVHSRTTAKATNTWDKWTGIHWWPLKVPHDLKQLHWGLKTKMTSTYWIIVPRLKRYSNGNNNSNDNNSNNQITISILQRNICLQSYVKLCEVINSSSSRTEHPLKK